MLHVCMCAHYYMLISVNEFNWFERFDGCKAHLVRFTADVQIRPTLLVGIDCAKRIKGICTNYTGKLKEN